MIFNVNERFKLSDKFLENYKDKQPEWGPLGYLTYKRSYSRNLENENRTEEFWETIKRVVEGCYTIQLNHCRYFKLPWNAYKAQKSAQEMYRLMWEFKFLPPGRGLWAMGSDVVWMKGSASLNNPLHIDTKVLTKENGYVKLRSLIGKGEVTVASSNKLYARESEKNKNRPGTITWVKAKISNVEEHPCKKITYKSRFMDKEYTVIASENHRWFVKNKVKEYKWKRINTSELKEGMYLPSVFYPKYFNGCKYGAMHGFFYGDGTKLNGELHQFGEENIKVLTELFGESTIDFVNPLKSGVSHAVTRHLPLAWGKLPNEEYLSDKKYMYSFLSGYFAADGCFSENSLMINSSKKDDLMKIAEMFNGLGIRTSEIKLSSISSNFCATRELYEIRFNIRDVDESFFLKKEHKEKYKKSFESINKKELIKIIKIEDMDELQPVMCLTVPKYEQFIIEGNAVTSNCLSRDTDMLISDDFDYKMVKIGDYVGKKVKVLNGNKTFSEVTVNSYGTQKLYNIKFKSKYKGKYNFNIKATKNHRWILSDGYITSDIRVGDKIKTTKLDIAYDNKEYEDGVNYAKNFFSVIYNYRTTVPTVIDPELDDTTISFKKGFFDTWIKEFIYAERDGRTVVKTNSCILKDLAVLYLPILGYNIISLKEEKKVYKKFENSEQTNYIITVFNEDVEYIVDSITEELEDEVFCVEEPETNSFMISHGIITGNCAFVSTKDIDYSFSEPFEWAMDMSMMGVGVGYDLVGNGKVNIVEPKISSNVIVVDDSKEGWCEAIRVVLDSYVGKAKLPSEFDYSKIRPAGSLIKTFGGIAPGPDPLIKCIEELKTVLNNRINQQITSVDIVDLFNIIGKCVVSGGVRRCLPQNTIIHTNRGLIPIKDVTTEDMVVTTSGFKRVLENVYQGSQKLFKITTELGEFICTPQHRMKVFKSVRPKVEFEFKRAYDLQPGDKMVFCSTYNEIGINQNFENFEYIRPKNSTTCKDITIPSLSPDLAWFLGVFHGDGSVSTNTVLFATDTNQKGIIKKYTDILKSFGVNYSLIPEKPGDRCVRIHCKSKQLFVFLSRYKTSNTSIVVPSEIMCSDNATRAAYLAGVFDADGCSYDRPINLCASIYPNFLKQLQILYSSLGIPTSIKLHRPAVGNWKPLFYLTVKGDKPLEKIKKIFNIYSQKYEHITRKKSQCDFGFDKKFIFNNNTSKGKLTESTFEKKYKTSLYGCTPISVIKVEYLDDTDETYDLSVEDVNEFVCDTGYVSHNTALLSLGSSKDDEYVDMKNPEKYGKELKDWRWSSNNSVVVEKNMDYKSLSERVIVNGEPGFINMDLIRKYGRLKDGITNRDEKALGTNPCG